MSKAPYRHSDGSDCYTVNCSRGHYTSADAAIAKGDINAFLDAKEAEVKPLPTDFVMVDGQGYNATKLIMLGYDEKRATELFTRPIGDGKEPPTPKHVALRINSLMKEKAFNDKYDKVVERKFTFGTPKKEKQNFYKENIKELEALKKDVEAAGEKVMYAEQTRDWDRDSRRSRMYLDFHDIPAGPDDLWQLPERSAERDIVIKFDNLKSKLQDEKFLEKPLPYNYMSKEDLRAMRKSLRQQLRRNW